MINISHLDMNKLNNNSDKKILRKKKNLHNFFLNYYFNKQNN